MRGRIVAAGMLVAALALPPASGLAQSSSNPFAGLFGRGDPLEDSPVRLRIDSGGDATLDRLLTNASLTRGALLEDRTDGQDILAAARADYARLLGTLYDEGHYSAVIAITLDGREAASIAPLDAPDVVSEVVIAVDPGPRFAFARADLGPVAEGSAIPEEYAVGRPAGTGTIRDAALAGVEGWRQAGHAKADVAATDIVADHVGNTVDSRVALEPGPVVTLGPLTVIGQDRMSERRLRKIAGYRPGLRYDPDHLDTVRTRLRRTGVFSAITLTEADDLAPGAVLPMTLTVVEQKPRRVGAGFELSNTDGAMVSAYWMHRNLRGGAERLRVDAEISDIGSDLSGLDAEAGVRLERPATFHPDVTAYVQARAERVRELDYDLDKVSAGFGVLYQRSERLTADAAIEYVAEDVTDRGGTSTYEVLAFPTNVTWDRRDVPTDARSGYWLAADVTPFLGFGDTGSGARLVGEGRAFRSFGAEDRVTLAGRARLGSILGAEIAETPRDYLFWSGGGGTVRGQPFESLGVRVIPGPGGPIETGGMSLAILSAEARVQVRPRIGLVAFADAGRVWTEGGFGGATDWHAGAGVGVRYKTPIGPLRFDIAAPVGGDTGDGVQLYLGLGQAF